MAENEVLDPEVDEPTSEELGLVRRLRQPGIPVTMNELAARKGEAIEILEARILILETARKRAIRMTSPEDWVLFKAKDDRITGYLQDAGCDRIRDITGIEIFNVSRPERIASVDGQSFMYIITGNGRSKLTMQTVEEMEGGRQSTDDFCKDKTGAALELTVRKAARANLDGNITRELAGLKSVPLEELQAAWEGTSKKWEHCRKGRGFGTQDERFGGTKAGAPDVEPPVCAVCGTKGALRKGKDGKPDWYGCPQYEKHPAGKKWSIDLPKWLAEVEAAKQSAQPQQQPEQSQQPAAASQTSTRPASRQQRPEPIQASSIFDREPGQDG